MDQKVIEQCFERAILDGLGLDLSDPNLLDTPRRIAKMYCQEFFCNIGKKFDDFKIFPNSNKYDQIIVFDRIFFVSMCAHHFLPFTGYAWLLYIPLDCLIGGSKPARLVDHYARRPQLQEHLCHEVINAFDKAVEPLGTMVFIRGEHGCMKCRGVKQSESGMITSAVSGVFRKHAKLEQKGLAMIEISLRTRGQQ